MPPFGKSTSRFIKRAIQRARKDRGRPPFGKFAFLFIGRLNPDR